MAVSKKDIQQNPQNGGESAQPNLHPNRTVAEWMTASTDEERAAVENDLVGRIELTILNYREILRDLGPYIVGEEDLPEVAKALQLIVKLLTTVQVPIHRIDAHILVEYFSQRLETSRETLNHRAGMKESAEALFALADMTEHKVFQSDDAAIIAKAIFAIDPGESFRDQKASTRLTIYQLLDLLIEKHTPSLQKIIGTNEFVAGFGALSEFEKEPTCLQIVFGISADLSRSQDWDLKLESYTLLWDSFSRYFPITLKASRDQDPFVPTPAELKNSLLHCFISNDVYAKEAFPQLIGRLDTDQDISANTKKDVFDTMASCITGYSISIVLEWVNKIWDSLKFEVWNGENEEFIQGALKVINSIASAFTFGPLALNAQIQEAKRFISSILKECVDRMVDSKQRYMSSTGRILYAVASSSQYMFAQVTKSTLPALLLLWEDLTYSSEKGSLLEVFNAILQARTEVGGNSQKDFNNPPHSASETADWDQSKIEFTSALITFKEKLVDSVYWAAMAVNVMNTPDDTIFRVNTIKGLVLLTRIPNFLTDGEQGTIIDTLNKMGFGSSQRDEIHTQAISALQQVSVYDPARFSAITLPSFSSHLPGGISNKVVEDGETETLMSALDDLVNIACKEPCIVQDRSISFPKHAVFDAFQEVMMSKLLHLLNAEKEQTEYARIVIAAISLGLKKFDAALDVGAADHVLQPSTSEPSQHPYAGIVLRLFKSLAKVRHDSSGGSYIGIQLVSEKKDLEMLITEVGNIATLALRSKQTKAENNFLNGSSGSSSIWSLFTGAEVTKSQMDLRNASSDKYLAIAMSMSLVAGIKREEKDRLQFNVGDVGYAMINNILHSADENTLLARLTSLQFLQLLVNKFGAASEIFDDGSVTLFEHIKQLAEAGLTSPDHSKSAYTYQTLAYFTAAALARCDKSDQALISIMIEGLKHPVLGKKVALSFRLLLGPSNVLTKENFCLVRPLRHGRLYTHSVDTIISLWRNGDDYNIKTNALIALAGTLEFMESAVYLDHAATILPLLLEGTNIQDNDGRDKTKTACIQVLRVFVDSSPDAVVPHLDSIINRMIDRIRNTYFNPSDSKVPTRAAALDVLGLLVKKIDHQDLLKRKARVLSELSNAVDDSSNSVRNRAVVCKLEWSNLGI